MHIFTLFFGLLFAFPALAQMQVAKYHETPITSSEENRLEWQVFPLHSKGVAFMLQESKSLGKTQDVEWVVLDTSMQVRYTKKATISGSFFKRVIWQDDQNANIYAIGQDGEISRKFHLLHFDINKQSINEYQGEFPFTYDVVHFQVSQQVAYFAGTNNSKWVVMSYNFLDKSLKLLPFAFDDREEVRHICPDTTRQELMFVVANTDFRKRKIYIQPYSSLIGNGKRLDLIGKPREVRKRTFVEALSFHPYPTKNDIWTIGAYSFEPQNNVQGLFLAKFEALEQKELTFFRFQDFAHFFDYLGDRRKAKLQAKMKEYNAKDREYTFERKILWNPEYIETPNTLVLMLTGYHIQQASTTPNSVYYNNFSPFRRNPYYWNGYPDNFNRTNNNNNRYVYDYVALVGFDKKTGRLLWDNMMKMEEIEQTRFEPLVQTGTIGDSIITAYLRDEKIYSQICYKREKPLPIAEQELKTVVVSHLKEGKTDNEDLYAWYDNHFLLVGTGKRVAGEASEDKRKYAFFCAKLQYTPPKENPEDKEKEKKKSKKKKSKKEEKK